MHDNVVSAINRTVPISQFNRGLAGKIFSDVKKNGARVVMKNNEAEVVCVPPDEYVDMVDMLNDYELLTLAFERLNRFDPAALVPEKKVWERLGITDDELDAVGEVEFE